MAFNSRRPCRFFVILFVGTPRRHPPSRLHYEILRHKVGLLLLHLANHVLYLLCNSEDVVIPLADGLRVLEPDTLINLVDLSGKTALLDHLGGSILGLLSVQTQQHTQSVQVDVDALCELVDLGGVDEPVQEHLLQYAKLLQPHGPLILVQPAQRTGPCGPGRCQDGALDGHGQGVQPLLLGNGAAEADLVVRLAGGQELPLGVVDAGLRELEVQLHGGVLDVEDDVLHLVQVHLGRGRVVHLQVVAHNADPHARLVLIADAPLAALERDLGQHARRLGEVLVRLVPVGDQLADLGRLLEEGGGCGGGGVEDVEGVRAGFYPEVVVLPVAEGGDEGCEEGAGVDYAEGLGEGLVDYRDEVGG
ncbi:hypothetical protein VP1G_10994 [Cytospora mali]|uniref:Uncharacterized protein n=1 Tax=Cytospora mali TaxID=578113 RepID=A0A194V1W5_CYTMA|nr:hypothetical protein VP1G_10994 [Valsa mali var. pyri (nom. inval.)]